MEQVEQLESARESSQAPGFTLSAIGRTLRNYIFWNYPRGSIHYDIMVTVILLFIFVTPLFMNFHDKPVEHSSHPTAVVVVPDPHGVVYQVPAAAVSGSSEAAVRKDLQRIIAPIAGTVSISKYEKTRDAAGQQVYQVWVKR